MSFDEIWECFTIAWYVMIATHAVLAIWREHRRQRYLEIHPDAAAE